MSYLIIFVMAFLIELLGTWYIVALQRKQIGICIAISLFDAVIGWAPLFFILYANDVRLFPFAVAGQTMATVIALRLGKLKGGTS